MLNRFRITLYFTRPVSANVRWTDIDALFVELGGRVAEREGSRALVRLDYQPDRANPVLRMGRGQGGQRAGSWQMGLG